MSTLRVDNITPSAGGTAYNLSAGTAKALWRYNQSTPSVVLSTNVSSITDTGTGRYGVNYNNLMNDADHHSMAMTISIGGGAAMAGYDSTVAPDTTAVVNIRTEDSGSADTDRSDNSGATWGDLA